QAFAIRWPADVDRACSKPGPSSASDPYPVHLSKEDRGRSNATYDDFGMSISMYEASPEVSPFSSKFDYALAHADEPVFSPDELAGWNLFRGRAKCNTCHLDGTESAPGASPPMTPRNAASVAALFTNFTSNNIGVPRNPGPDFVKAYMHNGYLKSLKEVVHFY